MRPLLLILALTAGAFAADPAPVVAATPAARPAAPTVDRLRLHDGGEFAGRARVRRLAIATAFGAIEVDGAAVAAISRDGAGLAMVAMADGDRLQGAITDGAIELDAGLGTALVVPAEDVAELSLVAPPVAAAHAGPWITLGASRIRARWTGEAVRIRGALGELALPVERIAAVLPPSSDQPLGAVALRDGSRLVGAITALPAVALRVAATPAPDWGLDAAPAAPSGEIGRLRLTSGDLIYGKPSALRLATTWGEQRLTGDAVRRLTPDAHDERLFAADLTGGGRLDGRLVGDALTFAAAWGATLTVPCDLVRAVE